MNGKILNGEILNGGKLYLVNRYFIVATNLTLTMILDCL
jgi:hypothetical protein